MASLVDRWQARLWAFARVLSGNDEAAWEIVQETWVSVVANLDSLHDAARFRTWVFSIARHKYVDSVRKWQRLEQAKTSVSATRAVNATSESGDIRDILGLLPEQDRSILALHYLDGFEYQEMAGILGVPVGTVKSRLHKARTELKSVLEQAND
ncbi:MAG: RNA polymerase sigma factor [Candidatus Hydrogenedentes bacterium]|nr:RNA polymerase sigma factor [Candidatus Hydrogenedentota bacterium]